MSLPVTFQFSIRIGSMSTVKSSLWTLFHPLCNFFPINWKTWGVNVRNHWKKLTSFPIKCWSRKTEEVVPHKIYTSTGIIVVFLPSYHHKITPKHIARESLSFSWVVVGGIVWEFLVLIDSQWSSEFKAHNSTPRSRSLAYNVPTRPITNLVITWNISQIFRLPETRGERWNLLKWNQHCFSSASTPPLKFIILMILQ